MADRYAKKGIELQISKMEAKVRKDLGPNERPLTEKEKQQINSHIETAHRRAVARHRRNKTAIEKEYHLEMDRHAAKLGLRVI